MKITGYLTENNDRLYDFETMRRILRTNKSKLYRVINKHRIKEETMFKNKKLYKESSLFTLMEYFLYERLQKQIKIKKKLKWI